MSNKKTPIFGLVVVVVITAALFIFQIGPFKLGHGGIIDDLLAKNVASRGGEDNWQEINTLKIEGMMSLGQGLMVPYIIDQKRPDKMCIEYEFNKRTSLQCISGDKGWSFLPFLGHKAPKEITDKQLATMRDTASIDGMLFNTIARGIEISHLGQVVIDGLTVEKLEVVMPQGTKRWLYLDATTGLEVKMEYNRILRGKERLVEAYYSDWKEVVGLKFPGRLETSTVGDTETQLTTIDSVQINPVIDDSRFAMPAYGKPQQNQ